MTSFTRHHFAFVLGCLGCSACDSDAGGAPRERPTASGTSSAAPAAAASTAVPAPDKPAHQPLNVLFITLDSLRADMPWQGYDKDIAPNLTKLAAESVVYPRAYSVSSYTAKSVGALLSGRYPSELYRDPTFFAKYSMANLFFSELLQQGGVRTMSGQAHGYFDRGKNLQQGFDVWKVTPGLKWDATTDPNVTSDKMTPMAIEMLSDPANTSGRFFMWLHYMDPHDEYQAHAECPVSGHTGRAKYDSEICYTDLWIKKLFDYCEKQSWWKDTAIIVSSDHGEAFGEHNLYHHAFALWEVLTRVPLMIKLPGVAPRRIDRRRSHIDLAPTILELSGVKPEPSLAGKSLVPELYGLEEPDDREPILLELPADTYNPPTRATIVGQFKLIEDPNDKWQLYDIEHDPQELQNLLATPKFSAEFERMKQLHREAWAKRPSIAPWPIVGKRLVAGGKMDGPYGPPGYGDDPDKK